MKWAAAPMIIGALMVLYLLTLPPTVYVPGDIAAQWDSIWLQNLPTNCTAVNRILCGGPKEFLGCVQFERGLGRWEAVKWQPASNMKRLPLAATGECPLDYNGMWHIHPAVVDADATKWRFFKTLSGQDLETLIKSPALVSVMTWAPKQHVAAVIWRHKLVYPVSVIVGPQ